MSMTITFQWKTRNELTKLLRLEPVDCMKQSEWTSCWHTNSTCKICLLQIKKKSIYKKLKLNNIETNIQFAFLFLSVHLILPLCLAEAPHSFGLHLMTLLPFVAIAQALVEKPPAGVLATHAVK